MTSPASGRVVAVGPDQPAPEALACLVREIKDRDPFCGVTVVVPSGYAALSLRYRLASGALGPTGGSGRYGLFGMSFLPLSHFLERIAGAQLAASGRRPLTASTEQAAVRSALLDDAGPFSSLALSSAAVAEVREVMTQLRWCSDSALGSVARFDSRQEHLVRLHATVRSRLAPLFYDQVDLVDTAAATLASGRRSGEGDVVVLYCLSGLHKRFTRLLDLLGDRLFVIDVNAEAKSSRLTSTVVSCVDPDEEVRLAVRRLCARMQEGVPLWQQAIFHPPFGPYATIISQQLEAAGIPSCGPNGRSLDQSMPGRFLLGLLDLSLRGWRRDEVIAWLGGSPVVVYDGGPGVPVGSWDALSIAAGVVEGISNWSERLASYVARIDQARASDGGGPESKRATTYRARREGVLGLGWREEISEAQRLSGFVQALASSVAGIPVQRSWRSACHAASEIMKRMLDPASRRTEWPEQAQDAYQQVQQVLRTIGDVDGVLGPPGSIESFRDVLACELRSRVEHAARFGDGVFVGPLAASRGMDFEEVSVLGLVESYLPGQPSVGSLLPDVVRRATDGELETHRDKIARLGDDLRSALVAGAGRTYLLWPRNDPRQGRPNTVSRWLLDEVARMTGREGVLSSELPRLAREHPGVLISAGTSMYELAGLAPDPLDASNSRGGDSRGEHDGGGYDGREDSAGSERTSRREVSTGDLLSLSPASEWELEAAALLKWVLSGGDLLDHWTMRGKPMLSRAALVARSRASTRLTRFDGLVGSAAGEDLISDDVFSATSLESFAICPMRYLLAKVLGVKVQSRPEDVFTISALDRGSLVHDVLELYTKARLPGKEATFALLEELACQVIEVYRDRGLLGRQSAWQYERAMLMRDLRRFHALDTANGLEPLAAELSFGMNGAEPVTLRLKSGREVRFRGRADRVDRKENGSLVVTDYKTGLPAEVDGLEHDWVLRGTKLQLPLYALAAAERFGEHDTAVLSRYWFVSGRAQFAERGYAVDDRVLERFRDVVEAILGEIAAGMFPARPGAPGSSKSRSNCKYCDFDSICAIDRERQWAAKHADARLAPYLELCGDAEAPDPALDVKRR